MFVRLEASKVSVHCTYKYMKYTRSLGTLLMYMSHIMLIQLFVHFAAIIFVLLIRRNNSVELYDAV